MKRKLAVIPAVLAIGAPGAQADKIKTCEEPFKKGWTTVFDQQSACNSNSKHEETNTANRNPADKEPPGQQP